MIDLNTLISNALIAAVQQAVAPLNERITALESVCATQHEGMVAMRDRIAALEAAAPQAVGVDPKLLAEASLNYLNDQEWFWEKMQRFATGAAEEAMDDHLQTYDHDSYDTAVSNVDDLPCLDDFVTRDSVREEIEDVLNNATLSLSV